MNKVVFDMLMTAFVVVFIVDMSGFSDTLCKLWARFLNVRAVNSVKPFTCSLCMTWWCCLIVAIADHSFTFTTVAMAAALAFMAEIIGHVMMMVRELLAAIIRLFYKVIDKL